MHLLCADLSTCALIAICNSSCGKVMFSPTCIKNSVHKRGSDCLSLGPGGGGLSASRSGWWWCTPLPRQTPPSGREPLTLPQADTPCPQADLSPSGKQPLSQALGRQPLRQRLAPPLSGRYPLPSGRPLSLRQTTCLSGRHPLRQTAPPLPETASAADGMHPTGMHSSLRCS